MQPSFNPQCLAQNIALSQSLGEIYETVCDLQH